MECCVTRQLEASAVLCSSKLTQKQTLELTSPYRASETKAFKYGAVQSRCKGQFTANTFTSVRTINCYVLRWG